MTLAVVATAAIMAVIIGVAGAFDSDYRHQLKHQAAHFCGHAAWGAQVALGLLIRPFSRRSNYIGAHHQEA